MVQDLRSRTDMRFFPRNPRAILGSTDPTVGALALMGLAGCYGFASTDGSTWDTLGRGFDGAVKVLGALPAPGGDQVFAAGSFRYGGHAPALEGAARRQGGEWRVINTLNGSSRAFFALWPISARTASPLPSATSTSTYSTTALMGIPFVADCEGGGEGVDDLDTRSGDFLLEFPERREVESGAFDGHAGEVGHDPHCPHRLAHLGGGDGDVVALPRGLGGEVLDLVPAGEVTRGGGELGFSWAGKPKARYAVQFFSSDGRLIARAGAEGTRFVADPGLRERLQKEREFFWKVEPIEGDDAMGSRLTRVAWRP